MDHRPALPRPRPHAAADQRAARQSRVRGIGVDERTAAIIHGDTIEVIGQGQVVLFEPPSGVSSRPTESRPLYRAEEIRVRVLATGDRVKV